MRKVEVSNELTVTIDGIPYSWDKETALQIAEGIAKSFGLRLEKDLPAVWPPSYAVPQTGLPGHVVIPTKVTYGTGMMNCGDPLGDAYVDSDGNRTYMNPAGGQADQVCAAENKKYKEQS